MATRTASKSKADKEREAKAKAREKEKAAKAKEKEKAARQKEKEREAKRKQKEREAKRKEKEREAKRKEKEKAAKAKEKEKAARQKEKEREAKRKKKEKAAKAKQKAGTKVKAGASTGASTGGSAPADAVQRVEDVAVAERGETDEVPAGLREGADGEDAAAAQGPLVDEVPDTDKTVRPKGFIAESLGKEDAVERSTQRATLAASYTTRDHDVIRAWAESRGGVPADVDGTGDRGAGVLRIEFPDGPRDDSRLEAIDWSAFFATFDDSDVDFLYQERVRTGEVSRFHKFVRADS